MSSVEACLELLKGPSDEKKLVGLLIASKLIKECEDSSVENIFNALGAKFLHRMLSPLSTGLTNLSEEDTGNKMTMISLALSLLNAFCLPGIFDSNKEAFINFAGSACKVWEKKKRVLQLMEETGMPSDISRNLFADSLRFLSSIWNHVAERESMDRALWLKSLSASITALECPEHCIGSMDLLVKILEQTSKHEIHLTHCPDEVSESILAIARRLVLDETASRQSPRCASSSQDALLDPTRHQLHALGTLLSIISSDRISAVICRAFSDNLPKQHEFLNRARECIYQVIRSKASPVQLHSVFRLLYHLIDIFGVERVILDSNLQSTGDDFETGNRSRSPTMRNLRFFRDLCARGQIELGLLLRDARFPEAVISRRQLETAVADGGGRPVALQTAGVYQTTGERALDLVPVYLSCFEWFVDLVVVLSERTDDGMLAKAFLEMQQALRHLLNYVEEVSEATEDQFIAEKPFFLVACIRCIGRYLAENVEGYKESLSQILPFMIRFAEGETVKFLLPALYQLTDPESEDSVEWIKIFNELRCLPALQEHFDLLCPRRLNNHKPDN